jgi:hypothetical protein
VTPVRITWRRWFRDDEPDIGEAEIVALFPDDERAEPDPADQTP